MIVNLNELAIKSFQEFTKLEEFTKKYETYGEVKNENQKVVQNNIGRFFIEGSSPYFAYIYVLKMVDPNKIRPFKKINAAPQQLIVQLDQKVARYFLIPVA